MKFLFSLLPLALLAAAQHEPAAQVPLESSTGLTPKPLTLDDIPLLGFGTWNLDRSNASEAVSWAIQTGYRHIDCAAAYGMTLISPSYIQHAETVHRQRRSRWAWHQRWPNQDWAEKRRSMGDEQAVE